MKASDRMRGGGGDGSKGSVTLLKTPESWLQYAPPPDVVEAALADNPPDPVQCPLSMVQPAAPQV